MSQRSFSIISASSQLRRIPRSDEPQDRVRECERMLQDIIEKFDVDNSGTIDRHEFRKLLMRLKIHEKLDRMTFDEVVDALHKKVDKDNNGEIDFQEFAEFITEQETEHFLINRENKQNAAKHNKIDEPSSCSKLCKNFAEGLYLLVEAEELKCNKESLIFRIHKAAGFIILWALFLNSLLSVFVFIASTSPSQSYQPKNCPNPACSNDPSLCPGTDICSPVPLPVFDQINFAIEIIFTCDFSIRLVTVWAVCSRTAKLLALDWKLTHTDIQAIPQYSTTQQYTRFLGSFRSLVDMAIIIPYWIEFSLQNSYSPIYFLRIFALFRMFRLLSFTNKYHRFDNAGKILILTIWKSSMVLLIMLLCCGVFMIFFGSIMFIIESGTFQVTESYPQGAYLVVTVGGGMSPSAYNSIPTSMYFVSTTLTTVGYGDIVPLSIPGRFVASLIMFCGCLFISLPIAIISAEFKRVFEQYMATEMLNKRVEDTIKANEQLPEDTKEILKETIQDNFDAIDNESELTPHSRAITKERVLEEIEEEMSRQGSSAANRSRKSSFSHLDHENQLAADGSRLNILLSSGYLHSESSDESYINSTLRRHAASPNTEEKDSSDIYVSPGLDLVHSTLQNVHPRQGDHFNFSREGNMIAPPISGCANPHPMKCWSQNMPRKGSPSHDVNKCPSPNKYREPSMNCHDFFLQPHHNLSPIPEQLSSTDLLSSSKHATEEISEPRISVFERIYDIFNCEGISDKSYFWNSLNIFGVMVIYSTILVGVGSFIIATVPSYQYSPRSCSNPACDNDPNLCPGQVICEPQPFNAFVQIDQIFIIIFTVDYLVRFILCWSVPPGKNFVTKYSWELPDIASGEDRYSTMEVMPKSEHLRKATLGFVRNPQFSKLEFYARYVISIRSIVDLACVIPAYPTYFGVSSFNSTWVRAFRVLRIFKLILLSRAMRNMISMVGTAFWMSFDALVMFFIVVVAGAVIFGTIMFYIETGNFTVTADYPTGVFLVPTVNGFSVQESLYSSVSVGLYYTFTTLTTVGYGDITPTTHLGRFFAVLIQFSSVLMLALPVGIVGANFTKVYNDFQTKHIFVAKLRTLLKSVVSRLPLNQEGLSKSNDVEKQARDTSKIIFEDINENDTF